MTITDWRRDDVRMLGIEYSLSGLVIREPESERESFVGYKGRHEHSQHIRRRAAESFRNDAKLMVKRFFK